MKGKQGDQADSARSEGGRVEATEGGKEVCRKGGREGGREGGLTTRRGLRAVEFHPDFKTIKVW